VVLKITSINTQINQEEGTRRVKRTRGELCS